MKSTQLILAIVALIMSAYFWFMRFDVVERIFTRGIANADIGTLLLPLILLLLGIVLLLRTLKKKPNEK